MKQAFFISLFYIFAMFNAFIKRLTILVKYLARLAIGLPMTVLGQRSHTGSLSKLDGYPPT